MYQQNCVLCCILLLVATSSNFRRNYKNDDEQSTDLTVQQDFHVNFKKVQSDKDESIRNKSHENSTKNYDEVLFLINSTKDDHDNNDSIYYDFSAHTITNDEESTQMELESETSSRKDENNTVSQQIYGNFTNTEGKNYTVDDNNNTTFPNETCKNNTCIHLCCPHGDRFIQEKCVSEELNYSFPDVYMSNNLSQKENKSLDEIFDQLIVQYPCQKFKKGSFVIHPNEYKILSNGSLYLPSYNASLKSQFYCLAAVNSDIYDVITCKWGDTPPIFLSICLVVSLPFLLATFVVYSILPEFQNVHGHTLRAHVASLFVSYTIFPFLHQIRLLEMGHSVCISLAYLLTFSFAASFLWLNVISFDIWCTFREIRSREIERNLKQKFKQKKRKKVMLYSIYAWGTALFLDIICAIVDYVPGTEEYLIQPKFCKSNSWFGNPKAKTFYFYLPVGITIISNICFFVITAFKIISHKRRTANELRIRISENKLHDDNKQRFIMYLKLFIVMGITWIMEVISWFHTNEKLNFIWYPTDMINALQGVIIFVIFICRKKIIQQVLTRLGWQDCSLLHKKSASSDNYSSTTTISETVMDNVPHMHAN